MFGIDVFDILHDVGEERLTENLVLATEKLEEKLQEVGRRK